MEISIIKYIHDYLQPFEKLIQIFMLLASIFLFFWWVNFACILVYFPEDVKLTRAHCLQCLISKHSGQACVFWDGQKFAEIEWGQEEGKKCKPYFAGG